jgi:hypothetical protein
VGVVGGGWHGVVVLLGQCLLPSVIGKYALASLACRAVDSRVDRDIYRFILLIRLAKFFHV